MVKHNRSTLGNKVAGQISSKCSKYVFTRHELDLGITKPAVYCISLQNTALDSDIFLLKHDCVRKDIYGMVIFTEEPICRLSNEEEKRICHIIFQYPVLKYVGNLFLGVTNVTA